MSTIKRSNMLVAGYIILAIGGIVATYGAFGVLGLRIPAVLEVPASWNPNVTCTPVVITLEQLIGTQVTSFGGGSLQGSNWGSYDLGYIDANSNNIYDFSEVIVFDTDRDGVVDSSSAGDAFVTEGEVSRGDRIVSVFPDRGATTAEVGQSLKKDMKIKFIDGTFVVQWFDNGSTLNTSFDPDETLIYDSNDNGVVDTGEKRVNVTPVVDASSTEIGKTLSVATHGGVPNKRDLSPDCTYTNRFGQSVSTFVQVNGVFPTAWKTESADCDTIFNGINGGGPFMDFNSDGSPDVQCDNTGNWQTFGLTGSCSSSATGDKSMCIHRTHNEIDHNWFGRGWCGASTACANATLFQYIQSGSTPQSVSLDIQGFVFWDSPHTQIGHNQHGWEIHPLTAWRLTPPPPPPAPTIDFVWTPQYPIPNQQVTFSSSIIGGNSPFTVYWSFGDSTPMVTGFSVSHTYSAVNTYAVNATVVDSTAQKSTAIKQVQVIQPSQQLQVSFTFAPSQVGVGLPVTFSSTVSGGLQPYSYTWDFGDNSVATGSTVSHTYSLAGTYTVTVQVTDSTTPIAQTAFSSQSLTVTAPTPGLVASFTWSPIIPTTGQQVVFLSTISGGTQPYAIGWNFGDGVTAAGLTVTHAYTTAGNYEVILTVTDAASGQTVARNTITVTTTEPPPIPIPIPNSFILLIGIGMMISGAVMVRAGGVSVIKRVPIIGRRF